jgi:hypothetical protein
MSFIGYVDDIRIQHSRLLPPQLGFSTPLAAYKVTRKILYYAFPSLCLQEKSLSLLTFLPVILCGRCSDGQHLPAAMSTRHSEGSAPGCRWRSSATVGGAPAHILPVSQRNPVVYLSITVYATHTHRRKLKRYNTDVKRTCTGTGAGSERVTGETLTDAFPHFPTRAPPVSQRRSGVARPDISRYFRAFVFSFASMLPASLLAADMERQR